MTPDHQLTDQMERFAPFLYHLGKAALSVDDLIQNLPPGYEAMGNELRAIRDMLDTRKVTIERVFLKELADRWFSKPMQPLPSLEMARAFASAGKLNPS